MYQDCFTKILYSYQEIQEEIKKIAFKLNAYYKSFEDSEVVVIPILDSSIVFAGHLLPLLDFPTIFKSVKMTFDGVKSSSKNSNVKVVANFEPNDIKGYKILVLDSIIDTGIRLEKICEFIKKCDVLEIKTCTLFNKANDFKDKKYPDWFGLRIPNEWVAGFGLDSRDKYRNFKHLGVVKIEKR